MTIRKTARVVASVMPSWLPMLTKSMIRVVTVWTCPGAPMMEGMP